jgi:hypothetical protein
LGRRNNALENTRRNMDLMADKAILRVKSGSKHFVSLPDPAEVKSKRFPSGTEIWKLYLINGSRYIGCEDRKELCLWGPTTRRDWDMIIPFPE